MPCRASSRRDTLTFAAEVGQGLAEGDALASARLQLPIPDGGPDRAKIGWMAHAVKAANHEVEQRRTPGERGRGLLADLAPGRSLADELIAERRAEARAEDHHGEHIQATRRRAER